MRCGLSLLAISLILAGCGNNNDKTEIKEVTAQIQEDGQYSYVYPTQSNSASVITEDVKNGIISLTNDGFFYEPNQNYFGQDTAKIEVGKVIYQFSVTVEEVNDSPYLVANSLKLSANEQVTGTLEAYDADSDSVTFKLLEQPAQGLISLKANGQFTYTNSELSIPDTSFIVQLDDGRGGVIKEEVDLKAAFTSNQDKSNYYYSSIHSHLKKAENRIKAIEDDSLLASVYEAIAIGYVKASFDDQVRNIINNKIPLQNNKFEALINIAKAYNDVEKEELANEYRLKALNAFLQYVIDNGVDNISSTEISTFIGLVDDFRSHGDPVGIEKSINALVNITKLIRKEEYDARYGYLINAQRDSLGEYVDYYLELADDDPVKNKTYDYAVTLLQEYAELAYKIGYRIVTSGELKGEAYHSTGVVYLTAAVQYAMVLNKEHLAKEYLAKSISFYSDTAYDEDYIFTANKFSENTLSKYKFGLVYVAPYFSILYTELKNTALEIANLQSPEDNSLLRALSRSLPVSEALQSLNRGDNLLQTITQLDSYNEDDPYSQQNLLVGRSSITLALAQGLFNVGREEEALDVIQLGFEKVISEQNIEQNIKSTTKTIGRSGCGKYIGIYLSRGYIEKAQNAAEQCFTYMVKPYFSKVSGDVSLDKSLLSYKTVSDYFLILGDHENAKLTLDFIKHSEDGETYELDDFASLALSYMANSNFDVSIKLLNNVLDIALSEGAESDYDATKDLIDFAKYINLYDRYNSNNNTTSIEKELRRLAFNDTDYSLMLKEVRAVATKVNTQIGNNLSNLAVEEQLKLAEDYIELLASNRQYDEAESFIQQLDAGEVEKRSYLVKVSIIQALQDDFPSSTAASVDTDGDGKANFYGINVIDELRVTSKIELDKDSDGDGISDEQDINPLD